MLNILLSYFILLPTAFLCYLPVKDNLRYGVRRTVAVSFPACCIIIALATYMTWKLGLRENDLMFPVFVLTFLLYHFSLRLPIAKTMAVFSAVVALMSILTNYAACFDASRNPSSGLDSYTLDFSIFQLGVTVLAILVLAYPFAKYGSFLINQTVSPVVWNGVVLFSLTIMFTNLATLPIEYFLFHEKNASHGILIVVTAQLIVWILMLVITYNGISSIISISKMEEKDRIWEMQESQFQSIQKYIRASEKTRHDFRHNILALAELYHAGDIEGVGRYLDQYIESMPQNEASFFCNNSALNALLNYYSHVASLNHIGFTLRVNIPDEIKVSDVDMCSMVGNILENAVIACQKSNEKWIQLTILAEDNSVLYIIAVNSFNGTVRFRDGKYLSSDWHRNGIGLPSIKATAENYGGEATFSHEGNQFFSNVVIPL